MSYSLPVKSPFNSNVGTCFSVMFSDWYVELLKTPNAPKRFEYTQDRLSVVVDKFKMVRIYSLLVAGWEQTFNVTPEAQALLNLIPYNKNIEAIIGTTNNKEFFKVQENVNKWIDILWNKLQLHTPCVKAIVIGNEINANSYTPDDISQIMTCFKVAQKRYNLNIPVTTSFSNLPNQSGDDYSDSLVKSLVDNWDGNWNKWYPFVFINPYPDAAGINNAKGVYEWQGRVTKYYQVKYPRLQVFIGETGAEGSVTDAAGVVIMNDVFNELDTQFTVNSGKTVPTFMFESLNEGEKSLNPNQQHMGVYKDAAADKGEDITIKTGINVPAWI